MHAFLSVKRGSKYKTTQTSTRVPAKLRQSFGCFKVDNKFIVAQNFIYNYPFDNLYVVGIEMPRTSKNF